MRIEKDLHPTNFNKKKLREFWERKENKSVKFIKTVNVDYLHWLELQVVTLVSTGLLVLVEETKDEN